MTAVLSATDAFSRHSTHDDSLNYSPSSSSDWRAKYQEVADMLAETRAELEDFQQSSKELEEELEQELERTEKAQQDLKVKAARAEVERDEWKTKFMTLQTTHNTTTTSLQRELDRLRQEQQKVKVQLRDLEMGNDDLERNERAIASSLVDIESKYSRALEEKILLEHELLDKANIEEESQRLKDDLRDANEEISILKDQLTKRNSRFSVMSTESSKPVSTPSTSTHSSTDNLLHTAPPADLQLSDLSPRFPSTPPKSVSRPTSLESPRHASLKKALQPPRNHFSTPPAALRSSLARSTTLPHLSPTPTRYNPRTPRPITSRNVSTATARSTTAPNADSVPSTTSKSKGVQMVSEMRARVKNLEQRIHTRVPRLRMGSVSNKPNALSATTNTYSSATANSSVSTASSVDDLGRTIRSKKRPEVVKELPRVPAADTSGWVLIMEDSPSPVKDREKEWRRTSSPTAPSAFRRLNQGGSPPSSGITPRSASGFSQSTMQTGIRRPQSRLSDGRTSTSTTASTVSSIPTSISRPSTPTFLPVPSASMYASTAGVKKTTSASLGYKPKRASLGTDNSPPSSMRPPPMPNDNNVTIRAKLTGGSNLGKSRIGKPSGRRSTGPESMNPEALNNLTQFEMKRSRSGSTTAF